MCWRKIWNSLWLITFIIQQVHSFSQTSQAPSSSGTEDIFVWDNVLPSSNLSVLHHCASRSGLGHKAFTRPVKSNVLLNPIERTIDELLTEMGDIVTSSSNKKQYVEYWSRQEWRHIEAHADVDEHLAKEDDAASESSPQKFRYPKNGHVLYLQVGNKVRGPTCVFPRRSSGGDLLRPQSIFNEKCTDGDITDDTVELVTVPAVPGRLLRFQGNALHAVPRPADLWLLSFVKGAPQFKPEEDWGRSVILFNTWEDGPPKNVDLDEKYIDDDANNELTIFKHPLEQWRGAFPLNEEYDNVCNAENVIFEKQKGAKVWLLGNERRRDHKMRTIKLGSPEHLRESLEEAHNVSRIMLKML